MNRAKCVMEAILRIAILVWLSLVCVIVVDTASSAYEQAHEPIINPVCRNQWGHTTFCTEEDYE
jgi:hypothetical protein